MSDSEARVPHFKWAQDKSHIYMYLDIADVKDEKYTITNDKFSFNGTSEGSKYSLTFRFRHPINSEESKSSKGRVLEFLFQKEKESDEFWDHMIIKDEVKQFKGLCETDWNKWIDEEDDQKLSDKMDTSNFMNAMGGNGNNMDFAAQMAQMQQMQQGNSGNNMDFAAQMAQMAQMQQGNSGQMPPLPNGAQNLGATDLGEMQKMFEQMKQDEKKNKEVDSDDEDLPDLED